MLVVPLQAAVLQLKLPKRVAGAVPLAGVIVRSSDVYVRGYPPETGAGVTEVQIAVAWVPFMVRVPWYCEAG
jgi:hypothetical protein